MNYKCAQNLSVKKIENYMFILNRDDSVIHTLNETASFIWELLEQNRPAEQLAALLTDEFDIDIESAEKDIADFFHSLEENKMIRIGQ